MPGTSTNIPISPPTLALFIAYLFDHHYASSTVNSYVSAIGYSHKLAGLHDPTKSFFINQMLKGYGKIGCRLDSRLPITLPILHRIVWATSHLSDSFFNTCRFQAMCLFAFYTSERLYRQLGQYGKFTGVCWLLSREPEPAAQLLLKTIEKIIFSEGFLGEQTSVGQLDYFIKKVKVGQHIIKEVSALTTG